MTGNPSNHVLAVARWAALEPLIEEVRPHCNVPHADLHQTIEGILWRDQNGAKCRSIPLEFGSWRKAAQTVIRRARLGVRQRLIERVQQRGVILGLTALAQRFATLWRTTPGGG